MKRLLIFSLLGIVLAFLFFVWPTLYRYETWGNKTIIRINRITGDAERLTVNGWYEMTKPAIDPSSIKWENEPKRKPITELSDAELKDMDIIVNKK